MMSELNAPIGQMDNGLLEPVVKEVVDCKEMPRDIDFKGGLIVEPPDVPYIERTTRTALIEQCARGPALSSGVSEAAVPRADEAKQKGLTDEDIAVIKQETAWSDEIIGSVGDMRQYEILKSASLVEAEIGGRKCLVREGINLDYTDGDGITNRDRMALGLAPLDKETGKPIELHHLGQKGDSPLVELTEEEHRTGTSMDGTKNQSVWHDKIRSEVDRGKWTQERKLYWKERAEIAVGSAL